MRKVVWGCIHVDDAIAILAWIGGVMVGLALKGDLWLK